MSLAIRRASLTEDRQQMVDLFVRNFDNDAPEEAYKRGFDWHWTLNPAGPGRTWLIYERSSNRVVGTTSVFPRIIHVDGKQVTAGQVMCFAVEASHRSLGPAVLLQRATLEPVDSGEFAFCYDCPPHDEGMSTFVRMGMQANCEIVRYALPLRSDEWLENKLGTGIWTKPVVAATNMFFAMRMARRPAPGLEISLFNGRFGDEFSHLDRMVSSSGMIRAGRSKEFLNWRYKDNPSQNETLADGTVTDFRTLVARRGGELVAFIVFLTESRSRVRILDLFGSELARAGRGLLEAMIEICRREQAQSLYGNAAPESELGVLLKSAGFRPRERNARVVAYEKPGGKNGKGLLPGLHWAFGQVELFL